MNSINVIRGGHNLKVSPHMLRVAMFVIWPSIKFHSPSSGGSLVAAIKPKAKCNYGRPCCHFKFHRRKPTKIAHFSKISLWPGYIECP